MIYTDDAFSAAMPGFVDAIGGQPVNRQTRACSYKEAIGFKLYRWTTRLEPGVADLSSQEPLVSEVFLDLAIMPDSLGHLYYID